MSAILLLFFISVLFPLFHLRIIPISSEHTAINFIVVMFALDMVSHARSRPIFILCCNSGSSERAPGRVAFQAMAGAAAGDLAKLQNVLDNLRTQEQQGASETVERQSARFNQLTSGMLPLVCPRVEDAWNTLEQACKAAGIRRDRSRSRTPSRISPDSQAAEPGVYAAPSASQESAPDEQAQEPEELPPDEAQDLEEFQPDEQAVEPDYDPFAEGAGMGESPPPAQRGASEEESSPASSRAGAMPKWWPAPPPPPVRPKVPPPQASRPKSYWRAGSQRFGARGSLDNPNVIWHSMRAKARREGWLPDFGRESSKLFLFARPGPEQKSR